MAPSQLSPTEGEWDRHKAAIRHLYLVQGKAQKELLEAVGELRPRMLVTLVPFRESWP